MVLKQFYRDKIVLIKQMIPKTAITLVTVAGTRPPTARNKKLFLVVSKKLV